MSKLTQKIKNYVNQRFIIKYIDNRYWNVTDGEPGRVTTILREDAVDALKKLYPHKDFEKEKINNLPNYRFLMHKAERYIYKITDCIVDPGHNWTMLGGKDIFRYSFPFVEDPWDGIKARPSVIGNLFKKEIIELPSAIVVKYMWENYYHFFVDSLPQVMLCDDNLPLDIPIIVPYHFGRYGYVAEYFKAFPPKRKIIIQEPGQYFKVKELYLAKDNIRYQYLPAIRQNLLSLPIEKMEPEMESPERLFFTRKKNFRRGITNIEELEQMARDKGFKIVNPGELTLMQQVKLCSKASLLIAVHGAALTNLLFFRDENLKVLEIFPGDGFCPEHYEQISKTLGFDYNSIEGNGLNEKSQFTIDSKVFGDALTKLVQGS